MGHYTFLYQPSPEESEAGTPEVALRINDSEDQTAAPIVRAFHAFMLGLTFQPSTLARYLTLYP